MLSSPWDRQAMLEEVVNKCLQKTVEHSWQIIERADFLSEETRDFIKLSLQNLEVRIDSVLPHVNN